MLVICQKLHICTYNRQNFSFGDSWLLLPSPKLEVLEPPLIGRHQHPITNGVFSRNIPLHPDVDGSAKAIEGFPEIIADSNRIRVRILLPDVANNPASFTSLRSGEYRAPCADVASDMAIRSVHRLE